MKKKKSVQKINYPSNHPNNKELNKLTIDQGKKIYSKLVNVHTSLSDAYLELGDIEDFFTKFPELEKLFDDISGISDEMEYGLMDYLMVATTMCEVKDVKNTKANS